MTDRLADRTAVVTAAAQGIGRAAAELFAREGATVYAADIDARGLARLEGVRSRRLDVTDDRAIREFADSIGAIDVLFNCVGYVHDGSLLECDREDWDRSFAVNVTSMYGMIRAFLPGMIESGGGSIVNMSSVAGSVKGVVDRCAYGATKAAVIGLTKSVAADYVEQGIRCNAICPGTVRTPSLDERLAASGDYEAARAAFVARQPMGRLGAPGEIAELALYLAGDASAFTTGQCHIIDGGWSN